jgi:AcrR family transcriptional regulator
MMADAAVTDASVGNTQAERTALSDQKMFEMAIELVNERGTAKTTLKDIGEGAGYSRGLASYRFGSKDGLWMELFARFDEIWKAHLSTVSCGQRRARRAYRQPFRRSAISSHASRTIFEQCTFLWYESLGRESDIRASLAKAPCDLSPRRTAMD